MSRARRFASAGGPTQAGLGVVLAVVVTLGVSACGITSDEAPRNIPDNAVPEVLRGTPETNVPAPETTPSNP